MAETKNEPNESNGPLTPAVLHVLLALSEGPAHGYAVMKAVDAAAGPSLSMGPGTIYGTIQRLEEAGLVRESKDSGGREKRRRFYVLTPLGRRTLKVESARLARLTDLLRAKGLVPDEG